MVRMIRFFPLLIILCFSKAYAQNENLSAQDLEVIKSYQFEMALTSPILRELSAIESNVLLEKQEIKIDLLPIELQEITYSIKPIAHEPRPFKYYKGFTKISYGNLENIDFFGTYRHQVPNYFMYGLEASYLRINDQNILDKNIYEIGGGGFLRYYVNKNTWLEYSPNYNKKSPGIFGFNTPESISLNGDNLTLDIIQVDHEVIVNHQFFKNTSSVNYSASFHKTNNTDKNLRELIITQKLVAEKIFNKGYNLQISLRNDHLAQSINQSDLNYLTQGRLSFSLLKPQIGFRVEALSQISGIKKILPNGEFFLHGKQHHFELHYRNNITLNSYRDGLNRLYFINVNSYESTISEELSAGLSYQFAIRNSHKLKIGASREQRIKEVFWVNNLADQGHFDNISVDYQFYSFDLEYEFYLLKNLRFGQNLNYRLLDNIIKEKLPHSQNYNAETAIKYAVGKFTITVDYTLGDRVIYSPIPNYADQSDFQHEIGTELKFQISEQVNISLEGMDLLDNKFEQYTGYADYGRRIKIGMSAKF